MRYLLSIIFTGLAAMTQAQNITGIWRGHFRSSEIYQRLYNDDDRYRMEVQIAQKNKEFQAVTYSYKSTVFYGKADAGGTVNPATKKVVLRELKIVELRMSGGSACIMTCFLQYSKLGDEEFLEGTYTSINDRDSSNCGKGTIFLHKVANSDFEKEPFLIKRENEIAAEKKKAPAVSAPVKKDNPTAAPVASNKPSATTKKPVSTNSNGTKTTATATKKTNPVTAKVIPPNAVKSSPSIALIATDPKDSATRAEKHIVTIPTPKVLANRQNELVKSFTVNTENIELNIYDNGTIDNDTVSVYFDKKLVVSNARLTENPIVVKLHLDDTGEFHELVMVAENEGDIPPNTSLMVVKSGDKEYEVHITSTEQKNAVVVFKYEKAP